MTIHNLKIDLAPFNDLLSGAKTGEVRNDDRGFAIGDTVRLTCTDGRTADRTISHIQRGYGLPEGICVLSYTRAVPDVPELVRYKHDIYYSKMSKSGNGQYVLFSQAAEIIAQQNTSLQAWQNKWAQTDMLRLKAVEQAESAEAPWRDMSSAPTDGTIINVLARYPEATAGYPRYAGFNADRGVWLEYSRYEPAVIIPWAWRPRLNWPCEGSIK